MGWFCVHIKMSRHVNASDRTFRAMLRDEQRNHGFPSDANVYHSSAIDGGHCYYFSPEAAVRYSIFVKFWGGFPSVAPVLALLDAVP